jgi:hypothetical protein
MSVPTPLLDFFRRGEVARDVRLLAAQGAVAPRAHEQLSILILLLDDPDPEVRAVASQTMARIPGEALVSFLGRADVSVDVREFFADRGVFPAEIPTIAAPNSDEPLIDTTPAVVEEAAVGRVAAEGVARQVAKMNFVEKLQAAVKGSREMRAILIRDPSKVIALSVLSSPKVNERDVEAYARMATVSEDVLRVIGTSRLWTKNYAIVVGLSKNPKTPLAVSLRLLPRLNDRDLAMLSIDRNVPDPLRIAARRKVMASTGR